MIPKLVLLIFWTSQTYGLAITSSGTVQSPPVSQALVSILGDDSSPDEFFKTTWQKKPRVYRSSVLADKSASTEDPLYQQVTMGLPGITRTLENACQSFLEPPSPDMQNILPMVYNRERKSLSLQELAPLYGNNMFAAYLDGCSVVMNHCDRHCPCTAALCEDLQKSFPYAYANAYLTPPASQTVEPHADDRDVFVVQVYGKKKWKVYEKVPIAYPYAHEQVGKNGLAVPDQVLRGPCSVETVLHPGDALYIPRGYVHEACTDADENEDSSPEPSYHVTIALATFDWAWSGLLATIMKKTLDEIPNYRMALPVDFGMKELDEISQSHKDDLESEIDRAMVIARQQMTAENLNEYLKQKYGYHAQRSRASRLARIEASSPGPSTTMPMTGVRGLSMSSLIRAADRSAPRYEEEPITTSTTNIYARGIRRETKAALESILEYMELDPENTMQISDLRVVSRSCNLICDLTLLCFIRSCIERGELVRIG